MAALLWTQKQDIGPEARQSFDMAFDSTRGRVVCFGGQTGETLVGDTWEWDGEYWTQMSDFGPAPRKGHTLAYDAVRKCTVLFGGTYLVGFGNGDDGLADTWEWDGEDWTQVADTGPDPRYFHAMTYDSKRQRTLLYGGIDFINGGALKGYSDTWSWDGNEWAQERGDGPPSRNGHKMVYDVTRDRIILFGGLVATNISNGIIDGGNSPANDTWEYDGTLWTQVADTGPSPRAAYGMVYDGTETLLFGGWAAIISNNTKFADTWVWDGKHWTQRLHMGPGIRASHGMAYDSARNRTLLFGGNDEQSVDLGDTWKAFERPLPASAPTAPPK
jgi:hypothetical protein